MVRKTIFALLFGMMVTSLAPSTGWCWYGHGYGHHYGHYRGGYGYYGGDPWVWGLSGLVVGSAITAAAMQPPPPQPVAYAAPPPAVYAYPPSVPPGMCRWERYVLDGYGRNLLDQSGRAVKEYTIGPCQAPPY